MMYEYRDRIYKIKEAFCSTNAEEHVRHIIINRMKRVHVGIYYCKRYILCQQRIIKPHLVFMKFSTFLATSDV